MARLASFAAAAIIGGSLLPLNAHAQSVQAIRFLGEQSYGAPGTPKPTFGGTTIGGLSGLDYDAATGSYVSNSDDQASPRFYTLTADITSASFNGVTFTGVTSLLDPAGNATFATGNNDFENARLSADGSRVFITSEGNAGAGLKTSIYEFDRATGRQLNNFDTPSSFNISPGHGTFGNLGLESMTFADDGTYLVANEGPLRQDSPAPNSNPTDPTIFNVAEPVRLVRYSTATNTALAQYIYTIDPLAEPTTATNFAVQGLVDILNLGNDHYLALERSFTVGGTAGGGTGYTIKLYQFSLTGATDVSGLDSVVGQSYTSVAKSLLLDFSTLRDAGNNPLVLDNIEALTLGPDLGGGERALLIVSDDNFSPAQKTQFLAFAITQAPEPGAIVLLGVGLLGFAGIVRRPRK
ncbi:MAG: esterase-like activity of phytase family protein [Capsulimonadales bacterium]|nr:esterase-like activity of phytase family protein [Capsulimonadales bacterium]